MFTFPISRRRSDAPSARRPQARRPLVEDLEGRQLLSGIVGNHIGVSYSPALIGHHIGTSVSSAIQGSHTGTNVV